MSQQFVTRKWALTEWLLRATASSRKGRRKAKRWLRRIARRNLAVF